MGESQPSRVEKRKGKERDGIGWGRRLSRGGEDGVRDEVRASEEDQHSAIASEKQSLTHAAHRLFVSSQRIERGCNPWSL